LTFRLRPGLALAALAALAACAPQPPPLDPASPKARAAALAERADKDAAEGRLRDALDAYREAVRLAPEDARYGGRLDELRGAVAGALRADAEAALGRGDAAEARRAALALVEIEPGSPDGFRLVAAAAEADGKLEDAWTAAQEARARSPKDPAIAASLAALAMKTARFAEAEALYGELAVDDPAMARKQAEARLEFQVENLPAAARNAAIAPRITRAQLAELLAALVPEVAAARVPPGVDVATDALDRPERAALVKAIALGFFSVSRETHLVGADAPVLRGEMPGHLRRLSALLGRGDAACFATSAALASCGILPESTSRQVSGREAVAAIGATLEPGR
jgi:hypothetical protein